MAKEKTNLNKKKIAIIILGLFCLILFIINFDIPIPFRYEIKGTSQGYIYKIDRFTGKTWIVTPLGEKLIGEPKKEPEPQPFPIRSLEVVDQKATIAETCVELSGTVKNNSNLEGDSIKLRVDFSKEKNGQPFHYEVICPFQTTCSLKGSDSKIQPLSSRSFTKCSSIETFNILKDYKNWWFSIYPLEAKIAQD